MKRTGNLFERIVARDNLRAAFLRAARGKRSQSVVRDYAERLDEYLGRMSADLLAGTVPLGRFHQFVIRDPKERVITAPCFEERVLHHAIMNVCEPVFDRWLIDDTYACRVGRGREAAVLRAAEFSRRYPVFLKLDIRKYFDSIPHSVLRELLRRKFKDARLLGLLDRIIGAFRGAAECGLPIGSLTSQHFANFYLGWFDRFVKEEFHVRGYVRYMDDMVLWGCDFATLRRHRDACLEFLSDPLQLTAKPPYLNYSKWGLDWLGCRVFSTHTELNRRSRTRFRRRIVALEARPTTRERSLTANCSSGVNRSWPLPAARKYRVGGFARLCYNSFWWAIDKARTGSTGAGAGTTPPGKRVRRTGTGTTRRTGTTTWASAWP